VAVAKDEYEGVVKDEYVGDLRPVRQGLPAVAVVKAV
jgi:hypothetical protein